MTRRVRLLLGAATLLGVLPGCLHPKAKTVRTTPTAVARIAPKPTPPPPLLSPGTESPYHVVPTQPGQPPPMMPLPPDTESPYHVVPSQPMTPTYLPPTVPPPTHSGALKPLPLPIPKPPRDEVRIPEPADQAPVAPPKLSFEAIDEQKTSEEPLITALRCFLDKKPEEAVRLLKGYDTTSQEMLLRMLPLAVQFTREDLDKTDPKVVYARLQEVERLQEPLRGKLPLHIGQLTFCRHIKGFGSYTPVPDDLAQYQAGTEGRDGEFVMVYAEVRNFLSDFQKPFHVTRLACQAEIRDYSNNVVWKYDFGVQPDQSRSPRADYFINFQFCVPPRLPPGSYTLWIQVRDTLSDPPRVVRRSLDFRVTTPKPGTGRIVKK